MESDLIGGAAQILLFDLRPFAEAIAEWEQKSSRLRRQLDWSEVPRKLRELSGRRAQSLLNYASENGWIERENNKGRWRLSESGRMLLERGGFYMR